MADVLMPQNNEAPRTKKKGGGLGKILGIAGGIVGGVVGGAGTFGAGAIGGASAGMGLGNAIGGMVDPERMVVTNPGSSGMQPIASPKRIAPPAQTAQLNVMDRRFDKIQEDPLMALTKAQKALAFQPPDIRQEYEPIINQALIQAQRQQRYNGGGIA